MSEQIVINLCLLFMTANIRLGLIHLFKFLVCLSNVTIVLTTAVIFRKSGIRIKVTLHRHSFILGMQNVSYVCLLGAGTYRTPSRHLRDT